MWGAFVRFVEQLLKIPPTPGAPPGDEGTTRVFRAAPAYYAYRVLGWVISRGVMLFFLVPAAGALYMAVRDAEDLLLWALAALELLLLGFVILQTVFSLAALRLDYEKRWYLLTDRSLRIRQGVMNVSEITITFANIQNISISQGPIQRLFGISDLRVDTAGGAGTPLKEHGGMSMHTAFFHGVDDADRIRSLMQERLHQLRDAGLGDSDDASGSEAPKNLVGAGAEAVSTVLREILEEARLLNAEFAARPG